MNNSHSYDSDPEISVVIVVGKQRKRAAEALQSVLQQDGFDRAEAIIVDAAGSGVEPLGGADHPRVQTVQAPTESGYGVLRAAGVRRVRAPIVAFLEDHAQARPGWLQALLRAFEGPWDAVGVEVHNANPNVGLADAVGWINYGRWAPPAQAGEAEMLPGNNTAYRMAALEKYGDQLGMLLINDSVLQERMARDGRLLYLEPRASIRHRNPVTLWEAMKDDFLYHWPYGAMRARVLAWPLLLRLKYVVLAPVIVWLRWCRLLRALHGAPAGGPGVVKTALTGLAMIHADVAGQTLGVALGLRDAEQAFARSALTGPRPTREEIKS